MTFIHTHRPLLLGLMGAAGVGKDTVADAIHQELILSTVRLALADPMKELLSLVFEIPCDTLWGASSRRSDPLWDQSTPSAWIDSRGRLGRYGAPWVKSVLPYKDAEKVYLSLCEWYSDIQERCTQGTASSPPEVLTTRLLLQTLGNDWGRGQDEDMWIDYTLRRAKGHMRPHGGARNLGAIIISDVRYPNEAERIRAEGGILCLIEGPARTTGMAQDVLQVHPSEQVTYNPTLRSYAHCVIDNSGSRERLQGLVKRVVNSVKVVNWGEV